MKPWRARFFRAWSLGQTLFLTALPALAQQSAEENPAESTTGLVFRWLNFFLVFGGAGYLIAKYGGNFFRANARAIAANITEASAARAEAERELREAEAKIANLDKEVANLREEARRESAAEAERLRKGGVAEVEKVFQAARVEQAAAERAAKQELRELAASIAVERAAALLNERMNTEIRARMFRAFLGELGRSTN
jgi:F0F1-type ATP synthase membrane subunit b/b'